MLLNKENLLTMMKEYVKERPWSWASQIEIWTDFLDFIELHAVEPANEAVGTVGESLPINEENLDELDGRWNCPNCETTKIKADYKQCPVCDTARPGPRR